MNSRRLITFFCLTVIGASIAGWVLWEVFAHRIIEGAFNGKSIAPVNKYVAIHRSIDPANRKLDYFLRIGKPVVPRLLAVIIATQVPILVTLRYGKSRVRKFFLEPSHPVNLAFFRIVLFAALLFYLDVGQVILFSSFPVELRVPPPGLRWLIDLLPINPVLGRVSSYLLILACLSGLVGFYSRTSAALAALIGFYVLGIPQFFGKIDHYHHLIWFAAILAASPCGDVLSLDATRARRKGRSEAPPMPSARYALPLKYVMLLMGIIYFFAGVWKFVIGGVGWATSDTMKYILYAQWFRLDWIPAFRIDQHPYLYKTAGVGVIAFEIAFIFLLFFPRLREVAAVAGILFHLSVYLIAHINFWTLAVCYVVFIDFEPLVRKASWAARLGVKAGVPEQDEGFGGAGISPIRIVGTTLLVANLVCGLALIDSWPFAVYPTFAAVEEKYIQSLTISFTGQDGTTGEIIPYKEKSFQSKIHPSRLIGLFTQVLWARDAGEVERRGTGLLKVLSDDDSRLGDATSIRIYKDVCSVVPGEESHNPLRRELLLSVVR